MKRKSNKGITLLSLVITIIIMLILAGVVITLTLGNNGLIGKTKEAKEETDKQTAIEQINLKITNSITKKYAEEQRDPTLQELANDFCEDNEIEYVELTSKKLASLDKIEIGENKSFFTKLKKYPYEFEINSSLKIIKIDGKQETNISGSNGTGNTNASIGDSTIIEDIELVVSFNNGEYLELTCNVKTVNDVEIAGYAFLINGEVKKYCTENVVNIDGLTLDTNYTVSVIAMDKSGNMKKTDNTEVKTQNKVYLYKEGNEIKHMTNGWVKTGYELNDNGTINKNDNSIYLYAPQWSRIFCGTSKMIDLTKYSGLYIENEGSQCICQISTRNYLTSAGTNDISYKSKEKIDISSYNSQNYLHLTCANQGNANIKNVWLEY